MVVFWSPLDMIVLGAGTRIFGTIDRIKSVSAGLVGFRPPSPGTDEQKAQYAKLRQVRWRPAMASTGYLGGHVGPDSPAFLRKYVVPLLRRLDGTQGPEFRPCALVKPAGAPANAAGPGTDDDPVSSQAGRPPTPTSLYLYLPASPALPAYDRGRSGRAYGPKPTGPRPTRLSHRRKPGQRLPRTGT